MSFVVGCGGVAVHPQAGGPTDTVQATAQDGLPPPPSAVSAGETSARSSGAQSGGVPSGPAVTPDPALASPTRVASSDEQAITEVLRTFTYVLSGLDDNLNSAWLPPLAAVTTQRLAQAVTHQASAILRAREHGVGMLVGRNLTIKFTGPTTAAVAECENHVGWYLVVDSTGKPDPGIVRGYFVGTAQLIKISGRWYVDVYATTQTACDWTRR
jgi:hypothetical protein